MVRNIKCVAVGRAVGNSGVGKSSLLHRYATGSFPHNYQPPFRVDPVDVVVDEKEICIDLWDTHGMILSWLLYTYTYQTSGNEFWVL